MNRIPRSSVSTATTDSITSVAQPSPAESAKLKMPDAPSTSRPASREPTQMSTANAGGFFGRLTKPVFGTFLGASLLLTGCAITGAPPPGPAAGIPEVAQHVRFFAPGADGNSWTLAANADAVAPPRMAAILDQVARARSTDDGQFALVLDPVEGSKAHYSPWNHTELRTLVSSVGDYVDSGAFAAVDRSTAWAFFEELIPVFSEVGPVQHAGWGLDVSALNRLEENLLALDQQRLAAKSD